MTLGKRTILVDMDAILVDMIPGWLSMYCAAVNPWWRLWNKEVVVESDVRKWCVDDFVKRPKLLNEIMEAPDFFLKLEPMAGALEYFPKICEQHEVIILTQPPRNADYAIRDKRRWVKKFFPDFDLQNMIFAHKKYLVRGDYLFDDRPSHLVEWAKYNPLGTTVTIDYNYNVNVPVQLRFAKGEAWKNFYEVLERRARLFA